MKIDDLALEVVTELRSVVGRERFAYDDGSAHVSDAHKEQIEDLVNEGMTQKDFLEALKNANNVFADNLVAGKLDRLTLASGERHIADMLKSAEETGNPALLDSAREFGRALLKNEITGTGYRDTDAYGGRLDEPKLYVATNASWVGRLVEASKATHRALEGHFDDEPYSYGLNRYAEADTYDDGSRLLKLAARSLRADIRDHLATKAPTVDQTVGNHFRMSG